MSMSLIEYIIGGLLIVMALFLIAFIMLQKSKRRGISNVLAGGSSETYLGKARVKSKEKKLSIATTILGSIFALLVLTLYILHAVKTKAEENSDASAAQSEAVASETASTAATTDTSYEESTVTSEAVSAAESAASDESATVSE